MAESSGIPDARRLRIVFMGTPDFAVPPLRALFDSEDVRAVVCRPDRPRGRGRRLEEPPVKRLAREHGALVLQPEKLSEEGFLDTLQGIGPDLIVVAAYGRILRKHILKLPRLGCFNTHASLLPRYRGAAPINWCIVRGETRTGVTIMRMDEGMDTGNILLKRALDILPDETAGELSVRLSELGAEAVIEALTLLKEGALTDTVQDDAQATVAPMLTRADGEMDWRLPARDLVNFVRGMSPWPGAFTWRGDTAIKVHGARVAEDVPVTEDAPPGTVLECDKRLIVAAGGGAVRLTEIQLPGKKRMLAEACLRGFELPAGVRLG